MVAQRASGKPYVLLSAVCVIQQEMRFGKRLLERLIGSGTMVGVVLLTYPETAVAGVGPAIHVSCANT